MAGTMTSIAAAMAFKKNAKKKDEEKKKPDYESLLSGLPAGVVSQAVSEQNESAKKETDAERKRRLKQQSTILGGGYSANADKVMRQIQGK
jgi:hypothetical protein